VIKYNKVKLSYTCPSFPPENIHIDRVYRIEKDEKGFFITDGNYVEYVKDSDLWYIKMLFSPSGILWQDVDFSDDDVKEIKNTIIKIEDNKK